MHSTVRWSAGGGAVLVLAAVGAQVGTASHGAGHLPGSDRLGQGLGVLAEITLMSALVVLVTRRTRPPTAQLCTAGPPRRAAIRELAVLAVYLVIAQALGAVVGQALHGQAISFHLPGSVHGTTNPPSAPQALTWAAYNAVAYVAVPLVWFGRRYSREQLWLRARRPWHDLGLVLLVLILESVAQMTLFGAALFALSGSQMALGAALALGLSLVGTVLPTLVVVAAIVVPRALVVTRSPTAAVVIGGLVYTGLHLFDGWTDYGSPASAATSLCLLVLQYFAPGMFKALLTVRTGNAWVHAWAYHAVAPHVWADAPLMVRIFGLR